VFITLAIAHHLRAARDISTHLVIWAILRLAYGTVSPSGKRSISVIFPQDGTVVVEGQSFAAQQRPLRHINAQGNSLPFKACVNTSVDFRFWISILVQVVDLIVGLSSLGYTVCVPFEITRSAGKVKQALVESTFLEERTDGRMQDRTALHVMPFKRACLVMVSGELSRGRHVT
jgi:hypothetical protein